MKMRNGLVALTAGFLLMCVSGGVSAQTPQTMPVNPMEARKAMLAARAARMSQKAPSAPETGVKPDATGGGPGPGPGPGPVSYTYSVLYTFTGGADGGGSYSGVVLDPKGNLYGTTGLGGDLSVNNGYGEGVVFKLDPSGKLTILHTFTGGADGGVPFPYGFNSTPILDNAGNLYGATNGGGASGNGVVFKIDPKGNERVLYNLTGPGSASGFAASFSPYLLRDKGGDLYGTLFGNFGGGGGAGDCGVVFKIDPRDTESALFTFGVGAYSPCSPDPEGPPIEDEQGNIYGVDTEGGDAGGGGVVYKLDPAGKLTELYSFPPSCFSCGPQGGLIRDDQGNLYGVNPSYPAAGGEVFKLDTSGNLTVLYAFTGGADGGLPRGPLIRDAKGNLYGTTLMGGDGAFGGYGCGVVFRLDPSGNETVLHTFNYDAGGCEPYSGVVLDEKGNLYGVTNFGGDISGNVCAAFDGCGTVFKLTRSPQLPW